MTNNFECFVVLNLKYQFEISRFHLRVSIYLQKLIFVETYGNAFVFVNRVIFSFEAKFKKNLEA